MVRMLFVVISLLFFSSCYVTRAYRHRNFYLKDLEKFDAVPLNAPASSFYFRQGALSPDMTAFIDSNLTNSYTYAFLVIRNDSILYEKYFDNLSDKTLMPSFSVAKSFVATLVKMAQEEGVIKSLQDPITAYLPFLLKNDPRFANITLQHLLDMRSGIRSRENYGDPFSDVLKLGFTKNIWGRLKHLRVEKAPGEHEYKSVNTQLLALIVEKATGKKIQDYLVQKIWQPLGMETTASWNIDSKAHQVARAFCCINASARDFAKLGRLYLNKGNWNGHQLISANWITGTVHADTMARYGGYKNQWWGGQRSEYFTDSAEAAVFAQKHSSARIFTYTPKNSGTPYFGVRKNNAPYYAEGILGQFVFVEPEKNLVIVRLGHYWNNHSFKTESFLHRVARGL
ncbi:serine hydrolase domain-containing protein [Sediminibacterium soli]|uniref:serine hydrolase domain-containing protein n=1 Tax=Sediminibacterium soli TaxID=2698829 RepID=UPI001379CFA1|nr:serine hydrolase [Sediminibacterium soli]NCI45374.1 serine hydrolase [Sediminibacterium soli]